MANVSRKAIAAALLAQLAPAGGSFIPGGRRLAKLENAAKVGKPVLFLIKVSERHQTASLGEPPARELHFAALVLISFEGQPNAVPADILDDLTDAIEAALAPSPAQILQYGARQTLGLSPQVHDAFIDGMAAFQPGDLVTRGKALIPITVVLGQYP